MSKIAQQVRNLQDNQVGSCRDRVIQHFFSTIIEIEISEQKVKISWGDQTKF